MNFDQQNIIEGQKEESEEILRNDKIIEIKLKIDLLHTKLLNDVDDSGEVANTMTNKFDVFNNQKIKTLEEQIKSKGLQPNDFVLWYILKDSIPNTSPDMMELDTPDGDIEKLINELTE
ncbi:MAG: hypothetical protein WCC74_00665 [Minisyncoccia bacterium]